MRRDPFTEWRGTVKETEGKNTMFCYRVVDDVDSYYKVAKLAGAEIVYEPIAQEFWGRTYSCPDPEGTLWHFGSYDPREVEPMGEPG